MFPRVDPLVAEIAAYVTRVDPPGEAALATAWLALFDAMGCAMASTRVPECMRLVGPLVPGTIVNPGVHIPGTRYSVDPVTAAFSSGCLIRWLDFSDTWVALETGHPSDSIGALLAAAEYTSRRRRARDLAPLTVDAVLRATIQAYEIQGVLGLTNSLRRFGFDHAAFVRVASAATTAKVLGGGIAEICSAVSHAWCDAHPLRAYRQSPNTGSRKSWAGPDAAARGLQLALRALCGEPACGMVLTDPDWGMEAMLLGGESLSLSRPLCSHVMENMLFKAAYPGVVHAQTAREAAIRLHRSVAGRGDDTERIDIWTHADGDAHYQQAGQLQNAADRDHCLQYMAAVGLLKGGLVEDDFCDTAAGDRASMPYATGCSCTKTRAFTARNLDPAIRSSANGMRVTFRDGTSTERIDVDYPLGHASRSAEGLPHLEQKLRRNLAVCLPHKRVQTVMKIFSDRSRYSGMSVGDFVALFVV